MKKLNLLIGVLITFILFNCSSDDNPNIQQEPQNTQIARMEQKIFDLNDSSVLKERIVMDFNNGKPILWSFYNSNDDLTFTENFIYSNDGYLTSKNGFLADGSAYSQTTITYDNSNRLIQTTYSEVGGSNDDTINFIHNNDNTITANINNNGITSSKTFELNTNGIIYKEIQNGNIIVTVDYDNLNPITKTTSFSTYNYEYLDSGSFPIAFSSIFGANPVNVVLFGNSLNNHSESLTTKLISKITSETSTTEFNYTLNENNLPISKQTFYDGNLRHRFEYVYE